MISRGKNNKRKGSNAERLYAQKFRDLGYEKCKTARYGSRLHDDSGIDLINIPLFNVQIKAGFQKNMNPSKVLLNIEEKVQENFLPFSPERTNLNIIIHYKQKRQGEKRNNYDELVIMSFEDFSKIIKLIQEKDVDNRNTETDK